MAPLYVGIDFGTTNSSVAVLDPITLQPELRKVDVGEQPELIRTILSKTEEGEWTIGNQAAAIGALRDRSVMSVKTELRKNIDFVLELDGRRHDVTSLISIYLKELLHRAGIEDPSEIERLALSIPVNYDERRKSMMEQAAVSIGLKPGTVWFVDEPVAVLWDCLRIPGKYVLVFDFGGGTLDLAILDKHETEDTAHETGDRFSGEVIVKHGLDIGGDDLDDRLIKYFVEQGRQQGNPVCANIAPEVFDDPERLHKLKTHPKFTFYYQLKAAAERVKRQLSKHEEVSLSIPALIPGVDEGIKGLTVTVRQFMEMTAGIQSQMLQGLRKLEMLFREKTKKSRHDIDAVLLSGGSSLVTFVPDLLEELFPNARIVWDEAHLQTRITRGNARYALSEDDLAIGDTINAAYGIYNHAGKETIPIIYEDERYPIQKVKRVATTRANQTKIEISPMVKRREDQQYVPLTRNGQPVAWRLTILPHEKALDVSRISVTYTIDKSRVLRIRAYDNWFEQEVGVKEIPLQS
ncbi:Hsp70 family protein [Paenibacillus turpanensis]|uniref:Hsp70 family protein n=1 Tax=Paenibacillus turpanensis TaxID=2689078 RepID=UPI00140BBD56|nr:Hsp70 family protein [Paenibacillus turpanensis]